MPDDKRFCRACQRVEAKATCVWCGDMTYEGHQLHHELYACLHHPDRRPVAHESPRDEWSIS